MVVNALLNSPTGFISGAAAGQPASLIARVFITPTKSAASPLSSAGLFSPGFRTGHHKLCNGDCFRSLRPALMHWLSVSMSPILNNSLIITLYYFIKSLEFIAATIKSQHTKVQSEPHWVMKERRITKEHYAVNIITAARRSKRSHSESGEEAENHRTHRLHVRRVAKDDSISLL